MKKVIVIGITLLILFGLGFFDYRSKKEKFSIKQKEFEQTLGWIDLLTGRINRYFFEHGWFPDSLQQVDTIFYHNPGEYDLTETEYKFFVDPFSGNLFYYLPVKEKYGRPDRFYLLSAGIDSKIDNKELGKGTLKLYDSVSFDYLDFYFGKKDLLVNEGSIENWLSESSGMETSMKWLSTAYDPNGRKMFHASVKFYGVVDSVGTESFLIKDIQSNVKGTCYLAPSVGELAIASGDTVKVKGIYNKIVFEPDTTFTFLNCIILERN